MSDALTSPARDRPAETSHEKTLLRRAIVVALLVAIGYYVTAKIGFAFGLQPGSVSTLWMPNSILLSGMLLVPRRFWWLILIAAFPAHLASELQSSVPTAMILSWFISNSFQALFGAYFICKLVDDDLRFDKLKDLTVFLVFGAFLAPFLSSFLDVGLVKLNGWGTGSFWEIWRVRCLSNILATLTLVPVIVTWAGGFTAVRRASWWRYLEAGILTVGLFAVGLTVFNAHYWLADKTPSLLYWPLPFLLWATVRFGPQGSSTALLLVMFLAISGATHGEGPFVANSSLANALSIQWFLIVVSIPLLALAAVIQERRLAERIARHNEERLALAMTAARMGTWEWDIVGNTANWSDETKRMFGLSPDDPDTSSEKFFSLIHPEDRPLVVEAIDRAVTKGGPYEAEFRTLQPDGRIHWVRGRGKVLRDETGKALSMIGLNADTTDRKNAEEALRESNERNQAIVRALPDMMFLQTREGDYLDYYARDESRLLVPRDSFLGKNVRDILPPELAERVMECVGRLSGKDDSQVLEYSLKTGEEERHYEARLVTAEGDSVLSIIRDVTEARRAADALRQSEEKLLESHRHIRALAASLMSAEDSERTRIAHLLHDDVSQNIAAFGVTISRLKRKLADGSPEIVSELDRLGQQTNDVTTQIRRLSHQLQPEVLASLGLVATLESEAADFRHEEQITVKIHAEVGRDIPLDVSVCLYRVTLEALRNVSRHSGANVVNIALREEDAFLTLEISDAGRGFDVEKAKRESGIGLASAEERVKLLEGTFEIRSKPEAGTTIIARVPLGKIIAG